MRAAALSVLLLSVVATPTPAAAQNVPAPAPIEYALSFPAPHTHYVDVAASVPTDGRQSVELMMAVWTPGSYLVREYERHVEGVSASANGRTLAVEKPAKNRWRISTGGAPRIDVRYRVYGREMSVRTNWVEASFALINGAPTFLTLADGVRRPHDVTISLAAGWRTAYTALEARPGGAHRYRASDYDTLVDSPILLGNARAYEFMVDGVPHVLVNEGDSAGLFDGARAARDLTALVREYRRMWGSLPYDRYLFLNVIAEASGGLEHMNSTVLMTNRWATRTRGAYLGWLELASHELMHVWNVKRLRPAELGPFDYEREVHTESLWIAEGITEYYAGLALVRAGLSSPEEFLASFSSNIDELQGTPGRAVQSAAAASFDAWIKYYRPDENSPNTSISYYTKGAVLGFLLDARIRAATGGARSLDDVLRAAYERYAGARGYTPDEFRGVAEASAGIPLTSFWETAVKGTAELDYGDALKTFGLRFRRGPPSSDDPWLGVTTRNDAGRLLVSQVRRDSPAHQAGLNVDDEIVAIDEIRVRADRFEGRLNQYSAGDRVSMLVARREQLMRLDVTLGTVPPRNWRLEIDPAASPAAVETRTRWMQPPS
jgi:predicted metalloprotease with PDZ domain